MLFKTDDTVTDQNKRYAKQYEVIYNKLFK